MQDCDQKPLKARESDLTRFAGEPYAEMSEPLLSIIVLNYNGLKFNEHCLASILTQLGTDQLVFCDNASTDGSFEAARATFDDPRIAFVQMDRNLGFAGGMNAGAAGARGRYLFFLNNDTVLFPDALPALRNRIRRQTDFEVGQCAIVRMADGRLEALGVDVDVFGLTYLRHAGEIPDPAAASQEVFTGIGAALVVRAEAFRGIGGFDDSYFLYFEDTDLCWRLWLHGYVVETLPEVQVWHAGSGTAKSAPWALGLFVRNRVRTLRKVFHAPGRYFAVAGNAVCMIALATVLFVAGHPRNAAAVIHGLMEGLFDRSVRASRSTLARTRCRTNADLLRARVLIVPGVGALQNIGLVLKSRKGKAESQRGAP